MLSLSDNVVSTTATINSMRQIIGLNVSIFIVTTCK